MTIRTTRWSPDTCDCVIEYDWDDTEPESIRTHTVSNSIKKCAAHANTPSTKAHWDVLVDENPRKNVARQAAIDALPAILSSTGGTEAPLKAGIDYTFSYSGTAPNRVLNISFTGSDPTQSLNITNAHKNTIQAAINAKIGNGKVKIQ